MIFNSFQFLWLFPIIFIGYYLVLWLSGYKQNKINTNIGNYILIAISYCLYMQWNPMYVFVLLGVTIITYTSALLIERDSHKSKDDSKKKLLVFAGALLALIPLFVFKYTNFLLGTFSNIELNIIAPLGISFFTFQALGYLFDVYNQRIKAEHNWWNYMLFVSFFPQILAGPISKAKDLLPQIKSERRFDHQQAIVGMRYLLAGFFMKVLFADKLGLFVDTVYSNLYNVNGLDCIIASIFYTFQIYGDFAGYSMMAVGVGKLLGFNLINNFCRPYLSVSVTDFWHRWHISLSTWLKDYIYIPLGGSRCSKVRNYLNIFITFLVSGIWHGANWTFILWGCIHGVMQIIEKMTQTQKINSSNIIIRALRICITFTIVNFAWILFRSSTFSDAGLFITKIFSETSSHLTIPIAGGPTLMLLFAIVITCELLLEFKNEWINKIMSHQTFRWIIYIAVTLLILEFGVFDSGQFIYVKF